MIAGAGYRERLVGGDSTRHIALTIALKYHNGPTVEKLRSDFGMSRATAFRWMQAWRDVTGREPAR